MAGFSAQGATFTFSGPGVSFVGAVVGISVETPTAEVVDMTPLDADADVSMIVPTGTWSGGGISVDYIATSNQYPGVLVRKIGILQLQFQKYPLNAKAIVQSATVDIRTNEIVRGSIKFLLTDYEGV